MIEIVAAFGFIVGISLIILGIYIRDKSIMFYTHNGRRRFKFIKK